MRGYTLIRSRRRTVSLQISSDGGIVVRAPMRMAKRDIDAFVCSKERWIAKHLETLPEPSEKLSQEELSSLAKSAKGDLAERVRRFSPIVGAEPKGITIRAQRTRWGSCSAKGRLNLNCLLMLCPEDIRDYVVVHELCHLIELNHSRRFWDNVERVLPDYRERRAWLKTEGAAIISRIKA